MLASLAGEGEGEGSFTLFSVLVQPQAAQTWGEGVGDSRYKEMYGNFEWLQ